MTVLPPEVFCAIAEIARAEAGLHLAPTKTAMVDARVRRRLRLLGLSSYRDYGDLLAGTSPGAERERRILVNAMTTNVTALFRERHHFDAIAAHVAGRMRSRRGEVIRIWSAGGSDGSEAVSAVLAVAEACPGLDAARLQVLVTDVDDGAVQAATAGAYPIAALSAQDWSRYGAFLARREDGSFTLADALRRCIEVRRHNLAGAASVGHAFDAVLCRNVLIYFDDDVKRQVQERLVSAVRPGGILCLGHSERLIAAAPGAEQMARLGTTCFRRDLPGRRVACQ